MLCFLGKSGLYGRSQPGQNMPFPLLVVGIYHGDNFTNGLTKTPQRANFQFIRTGHPNTSLEPSIFPNQKTFEEIM